MDFYQVRVRETKTGVEVSPDFVVRPSQDLMVRGGTFQAVWDEVAGLWSTDEYTVQRLIDADLYARAEMQEGKVTVKSLSSFNTNMWTAFRRYIGNMPSTHQELDAKLTFADTPSRKEDYSSKRLPYEMREGPISAYDKLMGTLYAPEERQKLEWGIGSILAGDSKRIQKFFVLYGEAGTGKSTFLNILSQIFCGYDTTIDAKALTGTSNAFATESFTANPLVAIQHDGDLSKIEDNTRLNSIVSHEEIIVNAKYQKPYVTRINALLFIGTNQSVKITDAKSGLIRRLMDVHPTGELVPVNEYEALMQGIKFELGAIAHHCLQVYRLRGANYYSQYKPMDMIIRTDIFYNFVVSNYDYFKEQDNVTLKSAWLLYKTFCEEGGYEWRMNRSRFRDELRNYFDHFVERGRVNDVQVWNLFTGFRSDKLGITPLPEEVRPSLVMDETISLLDGLLADHPAQYAKEDETPLKPWAKVKTTLSSLDTSKVHYVKPGSSHIVIDFDLTDGAGNKSLSQNLEAASYWPATYAEISKGGSGVHLHYLFEGQTSELSSVYDKGIEVKTFNGDASLRRRVSKCNNIPVATISSGLPRKERRVLDVDQMKSEKGIRDLIERNLQKKIHGGTKPSIDFIWKILEDAWTSGIHYDLTDMRNRILAFANGSTNQAAYCIRTVLSMKFASESALKEPEAEPVDDRIVFYDLEVFPNLFVCCWKYKGVNEVVRMINPGPAEMEQLAKLKLIGFNNRRYDNHIIYARIMGYNNLQLFQLSQKITSGQSNAMFGDAYNLSYADIFDFSSIKQSLKKFQILLGLDHAELGLPWDEPVPDDKVNDVVEYCANDVTTSEQVFDDRYQDYVARQILAELSGLTVNDTTQRHTAAIVFQGNRDAAKEFEYTDLSGMFPGYEYSFGKSTYKDEVVGEGGYVYAEPGMYTDVAVLDVASMHPTSIALLNLFGPYTKNFNALKEARLAIKRGDFDAAGKLLDGRLLPFLVDNSQAVALSYALKIIINIVYGLTSAQFDNPFRDVRNKDNIVAKRGALFMIDLKHYIQSLGFKCIHIKTDSVKIPDATPEIIELVKEFGLKYGYEFEYEGQYEKFCLVNDAVYVAKGGVPQQWTAVGAQFQEPYVFKTLFSGEEVTFDDLVQIKTVTAALYLDFGNGEPHFVGRAGAFVPVREGTGGGTLLRGKDGQFHAASGTKGYFWREAQIVKALGLEDTIDMSYFQKLTDAALDNLAKFGDTEWFRQ